MIKKFRFIAASCRTLLPITLAGLMFAAGSLKAADMSMAESAYSFSFTGIDGQPLPLEKYRGKVLLVVNTASQCGFTPQYAQLEDLYEKYKDQGLVVIGVPSDNFGNQEPGTDEEIKAFTAKRFKITFPLTSKVDVVGKNRHPFYAWAQAENKGGFLASTPRWNFHKYLVGRDGQLIDSFVSLTSPASDKIADEIQAALAQTAP